MTGDAAPRPVGSAASAGRVGWRSSLRLLLPTVLVAALLAGCGSMWSGPPSEIFEEGEEVDNGEQTKVTVQVRNNHRMDVRVRILAGGRNARLGLVTSQHSASFDVSRALLGPATTIRLVAEPIGSTQAFTSERIHIERGDTVHWTLQPRLAESWVRVN